MMVNDVDPDRLRRLAELRPDGARVLSIYIDRNPETFASPRAVMTEVHSALDAAGQQIEACADGLDHGALVALREDLDRVREALLEVDNDANETLDPDLDLKGARALAIFACGPAGVFEMLKLPAPVDTRVTVDQLASLEPLVRVSAGRERIAVAIVDREHARIFHGTADELEEVEDPEAERRHRRLRAEDAEAHFRAVGDHLLALLQERGFDVLVLDARDEVRGEVEAALHPYVRERLAGEVRLELHSATTDDVRRAAAELLRERRERHVAEMLARLREGLGRGVRAAAGLEDVRAALEQRRVEALVYEATRELPRLDDMVDAAVLQDAEVLAVDPAEHPELGPHEGVGAVLRF